MAANYVLLEKITVGAAGASSVIFSSIPQTGYTDLVVKVSARSSTNNTYDDLQAKFNGVSLSYTNINLSGPGNGIAVGSGTNAYTTSGYIGSIPALTATASVLGNAEIYIPNYTSANYKSFSCDVADERNITTGVFSCLNANLWSNTAAITSIQFLAAGGDFVQYSTFYLYGVAALGTTPVIVPYATGGDTIMTDGSYWYHTFKASGTFTPLKGLTADYLVVAGGGGGGVSAAGGGGAGGLRSTVTATGGGGTLETPLSLAVNTSYVVTVGAGGRGYNGSSGSLSGSNSTFSTITSIGGGWGGSYLSEVAHGSHGASAGTGGSGGGARFSGDTTPGAGTANQGYAGGNSNNSGNPFSGGGGGGAGQVGGNASTGVGGNGGNGVANSITGSSVTYAGGGGGEVNVGTAGTGGTGGGGAGAVQPAAGTAGTANTGGGGGAGESPGGAGGSGIVIVRYAV